MAYTRELRILGLNENSTLTDLKKSYRILVKRYHPDRNPGESRASAKFTSITDAYQTLHEYFLLKSELDTFNMKYHCSDDDDDDSLEFRGDDVHVDRFITLEEAFTGLTVILRYPRRVKCDACVPLTPCNKCNGMGYVSVDTEAWVEIPKGIRGSEHLRVSNAGHCGENGGSDGDLLVEVIVKEHPSFKVFGDDLIYEIPLSLKTCLLGGKISIPTIDGESMTLKLKECCGNHSHTIHAKGWWKKDGKFRGDLLVVIRVDWPAKLTQRQRILLSEFDEELK